MDDRQLATRALTEAMWRPGRAAEQPDRYTGLLGALDLPLRNDGVVAYDAALPKWPEPPWTPLRNVFPRWHSGKVCYTLPSGNQVHVKPSCRC